MILILLSSVEDHVICPIPVFLPDIVSDASDTCQHATQMIEIVDTDQNDISDHSATTSCDAPFPRNCIQLLALFRQLTLLSN